jgi:hypothetical protein
MREKDFSSMIGIGDNLRISRVRAKIEAEGGEAVG